MSEVPEGRPVENQGVPPAVMRRRWRWTKRALVAIGLYLLVAYVVLPAAWHHYEHQPNLEGTPKVTVTGSDIPGDPLNIGLVGTQEEVVRAMLAAGWHPADAVTARSSIHIAESVLLDRKYEDAPVSSLYVWGRKQDLAFEQLVGKSAKERHHVRFWKSPETADDGRPTWLGAATFDHGVGLSHRTGQITHHIDPDIDAERDHVLNTLIEAHELLRTYQVSGVGPTLNGRNGGGDWYYTDGEVTIGVISPNNVPSEIAPIEEPNPIAVQAKNRFWSWLRGWLK
ncbi:MAG TPA: LssY C-terminal domain-containing protein [Pirellulales bacterium]|nr:LssY C-terminal domain-containing protein [Pirellulales bacterium]